MNGNNIKVDLKKAVFNAMDQIYPDQVVYLFGVVKKYIFLNSVSN
jgi:uncharacterized protein YdeI (BOF family)